MKSGIIYIILFALIFHNMPRITIAVSGRGWEEVMDILAARYTLFAPVIDEGYQDYEVIGKDNLHLVVFHLPRPTTPIKTFFLPVRQNVSYAWHPDKEVLLFGVPACDLAALSILDEMYLQQEYTDIYYKKRRENTVLIGTDCHDILENCHCACYGIQPYPAVQHDIRMSRTDKDCILEARTSRGEQLLEEIRSLVSVKEVTATDQAYVAATNQRVVEDIINLHPQLPDYASSGELLKQAAEDVWKDHASTCVSCGACATICPTCTCFLLIDRPDFEKIRQMDACQYPGFTRVAGGEDHLHALSERFRHRYMCKYVWKPLKFNSMACTGCGRCIDACIGHINKNEILTSLASVTAS